MVTFTINIPPMLAYIPYMDPMGVVTQFQTSSNHSPQSSELNGDGVDPCCAENSETSKCSRRIICSFFLYLNKHGENGFGSVPQFERSAKKCTTRHWYQQHTVPISSPRRSLTFPWWHPLFLLLYVHGDDLWPIEIHLMGLSDNYPLSHQIPSIIILPHYIIIIFQTIIIFP